MNPSTGTPAFACWSNVPRFPCAAIRAADDRQASCQSVAAVARAAAVSAEASAGSWDRFAERDAADRMVTRDADLAIALSGGLVLEAYKAAGHIAAVAPVRNEAAERPDNVAADAAAAAGNEAEAKGDSAVVLALAVLADGMMGAGMLGAGKIGWTAAEN